MNGWSWTAGTGGNGSGQHLEYCSGHCCATSIKQATYFKDANPDVDTPDDLRRL